MNVPKYIQNNERLGTCSKKKLPYVLSKDQLFKILTEIDCVNLMIIIFIGIFQGLRIGEIIRLKWSEVDLKFGEMRILDAKNPKRYKSGYGKDRIVPINEMFIPVLKKWKMMNTDDYVIPANSKRDESANKGLIRTYQKKFCKVLKGVNLLEVDYYQQDGKPRYKYHLHTLRHVCGTNLYRAGMDLYQVKEYLGHDKIETTQIYCELAKDDVRIAAHKAYAYPKSQLALPDYPEVEIMDKESLLLQREILDRKLELARAQPMEVFVNGGLS